MLLALESLAIVSMLELVLWLAPLWNWRRVIAPALLVLVAIASVLPVSVRPDLWTTLIALFGAYRCINLGRVAANRIQPDYLYHVSRQTALSLIGLQIAAAIVGGLSWQYHLGSLWWESVLAGLQLIATLALLAATLRHLRLVQPPRLRETFAEKDLPTLTVAIPARNETDDLEACLQSVVASTYPKLEVLVLDDCSQNKRTPEIIRTFAHAGVRFIAGEAPPENWLAKNYAYAQLAAEANGEVLLFCGVDTRFQPGSFDAIIRNFMQKRVSMVSVVPRNEPPQRISPAAWFMQTSRYAWELALPRRLAQRPPVLSTCWLISRMGLKAAGGFEAVRRKGVPESYFARAAAATGGYRFLAADTAIGLTSQKKPAEQRATAIRTRYLQLHRKPELTAVVSILEFGLLLGPLILLASAIMQQHVLLAVLPALSLAAVLIMYSRVFTVTYRRFYLRSVWLLPLAALYDIGLLNYSLWQYEFGEVIWKGRNVCIPVMRVVPNLPVSVPSTSDSVRKS